MSHCYYHCLSSVRRWGGRVEDYRALHDWFDQSKAIIADPRHRALRHHAEGIFMLETIFGQTIVNSDGRVVPVRLTRPLLRRLGPGDTARQLDAPRESARLAGARPRHHHRHREGRARC